LHKGIKCDGDDNCNRMTKNSLTFPSLIFGMKSFIGPRGEGKIAAHATIPPATILRYFARVTAVC